MGARKASDPQDLPPTVRVRLAPPGEIKAYVVYEHELDRLAEGSPASLFWNFALALLSASLTLLVTLFTTEIKSDRLYVTFVIVCGLSLVSGLVLLSLWWQTHISVRGLVERIKDRMPPSPGTQERSPSVSEA